MAEDLGMRVMSYKYKANNRSVSQMCNTILPFLYYDSLLSLNALQPTAH